MANLTVTLPDPMIEYIDGLVRPDGFQDRNAVFEALITDWQERLDALNTEIKVGLDEFERGEFIRVDDLEAWGETLGLDD
ncbi:hypothetical protein [Brevundimonas sp.]|uniref:ribbon-helix-helix domain-containing protein n=1 Tax=Brevundimonas sp. TaxID=1871086 RepID=UPI001A337504|nr:hypothetical protein [Brevundimonas sp.]MBJ7486540.1 hypothetical protein [Brevundimonas sp.]